MAERATFREALADSHVAAVAAAVLLLWSIDSVLSALLWVSPDPISSIVIYIATAIAVRGIPAASPHLYAADVLGYEVALALLFNAVVRCTAAWLLTQWVHGANPLCVFRTHLFPGRRQSV